MAVLTLTTTMAAGVEYTHTTASSSDHGSVSNNTYFYDLTAKTVYYKDVNGSIQEFYRAKPSVQTIVSAATITPTSSDDLVDVTASELDMAIVNPTGTYVNGQTFMLRINGDIAPRTLTFGTEYIAYGSALPAETIVGKPILIGCTRNSLNGNFECVNSIMQ
jgi:hypothetical protein